MNNNGIILFYTKYSLMSVRIVHWSVFFHHDILNNMLHKVAQWQDNFIRYFECRRVVMIFEHS